MHTPNPIQDAQYHFRLLDSIPEEKVRCEVDGCLYPVSEMKRDTINCNWVHENNLEEYLKYFLLENQKEIKQNLK